MPGVEHNVEHTVEEILQVFVMVNEGKQSTLRLESPKLRKMLEQVAAREYNSTAVGYPTDDRFFRQECRTCSTSRRFKGHRTVMNEEERNERRWGHFLHVLTRYTTVKLTFSPDADPVACFEDPISHA